MISKVCNMMRITRKIQFLKSNFSAICPNYTKKTIYDKTWINMTISQDSNQRIDLMKAFANVKNDNEYNKFFPDLENALKKTFTLNEIYEFSPIFLFSSLLFIKTKEKSFFNILQNHQNLIEKATFELMKKIQGKIYHNQPSFQLEDLKNIDLYMDFYLAHCLNSGMKVQEIYEYNLFEAFLEINLNLKNSDLDHEKLKGRILLKILCFYPLFSRFSIQKNTKSDFLQTIFVKLELYEIFKSNLIEELTSVRENVKFNFKNTHFLQTLFSLTQDTIFLADFLHLLSDLSYTIKLNLKFANQILKYFSYQTTTKKKGKGPPAETLDEELLGSNIELLFRAFEVIQEKIDVVPLNNLLNIIMFLSQENLMKFSNEFFMDFWYHAINVLEPRYSKLLPNQKFNYFYSIGKYGFLTPRTERELKEYLVNVKKKDFLADWTNNAKVLKAGINLKVFGENDIKEIINSVLVGLKEKNDQKTTNMILINLTNNLIRLGYSDIKYWEFYFKNLEKLIDDHFAQKFTIFYVLKTFPLIFNENEKKASDSIHKLNQIYANALQSQKVQSFLKINLDNHYNEIPKEKRALGSLLETKMRTALKKIGLIFIEQAHSEIFYFYF